jgi:hypothetical protein
MKNKTILIATLMLALTTLNAQTKTSTTKPTAVINQCNELKSENEFLKKTLKINEPIKTYSDNDIEIKLISAKGNLKTQKIKIEYLITNKIQIRNIKMDAFREQIVSMSGELIPLANGYTIYETELNTDVPIKTSLELGPILPENTIIKFISMKYLLPKQGMTYIGNWEPTGVAEFKDIPVIWK